MFNKHLLNKKGKCIKATLYNNLPVFARSIPSQQSGRQLHDTDSWQWQFSSEHFYKIFYYFRCVIISN